MNKPLSRDEIAAAALSRAQTGQSFANYAAIFEGFKARGIPETAILPRENVLTYNAWQAKGRQVRKGEKGVKVFTFVPVEDDDGTARKIAKTTTVFHITQTDDANLPRKRPAYDNRGRDYVRDPGEDAADRWNETHGDRY